MKLVVAIQKCVMLFYWNILGMFTSVIQFNMNFSKSTRPISSDQSGRENLA